MNESPQQAARRLANRVIRDGFLLDALHEYTDASGVPLYWRIRAKHPNGTKWMPPMRRNGSGFELGEPTFPGGKPLYRLNDLATRPGDSVLIVEGEACADALAKLGALATTSGAAGSAGKADWTPLAGRDVTIWPDNDEAGKRYGSEVAKALLAIGCKVRTIDVGALGLVPKGDCVDWIADHPTATAADVVSLGTLPDAWHLSEEVAHDESAEDDGAQSATAPSSTIAAEIASYRYGGGRYEVSPHGVFFIEEDASGDDKSAAWICSQLHVTAKTRDVKGCEWGRLLEWYDDDERLHQWAMPLELLQGDGSEVRRELARQGLSIAPGQKARNFLSSYLQVWPVDARARCVDRLGWDGGVYVTPTATIGEEAERVVFQNAHAIEPALTQAGTLDAWRDSVAALAAGNSRLVFTLSVAFAAPLAAVVGEDSGGFHLRGGSSTGKTTALKVAASVWGHPDRFPRLWRATTNGLEGLAALHNDGLLILDEISQIDPKAAGEAAYMLANGQAKARASRTGTARAAAQWRVLILSSGEESLPALMARAGHRVNAGQEIRLADIEADAGVGLGIVEKLHDQPNSAALVQAIKDAANRNHGVVGIEWLRVVVAERSSLANVIADRIGQFVKEVCPKGAAGQVQRVARRFGLVAVAGELASHYKLTGWAEGEAIKAARICFAAWLDAFGGAGNREERAMLAQVRAFFEAHGASRFEDVLASHDQRVPNRVGFYRNTNGARDYMVLPEAFRREICQGFDVKAMTAALLQAGWLKGQADRPTQKLRLPGFDGSTRCYVFTALQGEDE